MSNQQSSSFFNDLLGDGPEERTITYRGREKVCHFRRITGAERIHLLQGQTMQAGGEGKPSFKIDLADSAERNAKLVTFSLCDAAGKPIYKNYQDVKSLPDDLIAVLYKHASEINAEAEGEEGKP